MFELGKIHIRKLDLLRPYESHLRLFTYLTKEVKKDRYTVSFKNNFHERKCVRHKKKIKKPIITLEDFGIKVSYDPETNRFVQDNSAFGFEGDQRYKYFTPEEFAESNNNLTLSSLNPAVIKLS